jgi:2-polyprenyl-3-methyl-5-hydroxy-6-metoxy-1,4-benzoquinol methylase
MRNNVGNKHDILTEEELAAYSINPAIRSAIEQLVLRMEPPVPKEEINILDWGCGRGRSVAKLREDGFNVYGVDIDEAAMLNGYQLFEQRGLNPCELLLEINKTSQFQDSFFHFIFSEQVFEHVKNIHAVFAELSRLTKPGGVGIHCFPGSRAIFEEHIHMPLVHWLPKNITRKMTIVSLMMLRYGPKTVWPETDGRGFWFKADTYYNYLNNKTYYRDIEDICRISIDVGFSPQYELSGRDSLKTRWLPPGFRNNGFPKARITLCLSKKS